MGLQNNKNILKTAYSKGEEAYKSKREKCGEKGKYL
jgi:hypothetical protein